MQFLSLMRNPHKNLLFIGNVACWTLASWQDSGLSNLPSLELQTLESVPFFFLSLLEKNNVLT